MEIEEWDLFRHLLEDESLPDTDDVIGVCAGLVTFDEQSQTVRLVHYTTQEFFEKTQSRWLPDAEGLLARACIRYISLDVFTNLQLRPHVAELRQLMIVTEYAPIGFRKYKMVSGVINSSHPLYLYASKNWIERGM